MITRLILLVVVASLSAVATAKTETLRLATLAPATSEWFKAMQASAQAIQELTDGRVALKIFGGGVMGSDEQVFRKIRIGQLQGAATTPTILADTYKDIVLYTLPMVFNDEAEAAFVRARMDARLTEALEAAGFVSFGFATTGFSVVLSNSPIRNVDDMRGKKIWAPPGDPAGLAALRALDLVPVLKPMSDVYTSLQTGNIDVVPFSPIGALVLQLHTEVDYLTDLPMVYTVGLMVVQKQAFGKLAPADQQIVRDVMGRLYSQYDTKNVADNIAAKAAVIKSGVELIVPDAQDAADIRRIVLQSNRELGRKGEFSLQLYEEMLAHIAEYRSGQASRAASSPVAGQE